MDGKKKLQIIPNTLGGWIAVLACLVAEAAFFFSMATLAAIPAKYVALIVIGVIVIDVVLLWLNSGRGKGKRVAGIVMAVVVFIGMGIGAYYLYDTHLTLAKISEYNEHFEDFDVVVADKSSYQNEGDINGKTVYVFENNSKMYTEAKEKLITKSGVNFEVLKDINEVGSKLNPAEGGSQDNIIYISDNSYQLLCETDEGYEDQTRVLFKIKVEQRSNDNANDIDVTQDPFNICVSGIDMWGSIKQVSRSDVNMIITVNPQTHTILLTSVPRDSYVPLHSFGQLDKLTHSGVYGIDETVQTLEDWMETDIPYNIRVDFSMLKDIVNAIGEIDVYSDYEFESSIHHCDAHDTHYEKGWNHLNGTEALYFARERHAFEDEDQQRIIDQQKVMEACLKKVMSSTTLLTHYTDLLKAVDDEMETNIGEKEMASLVKMQLKDMPEWDIQMQTVKGDLTMKGTYTMGFGRDLLVSIPREESVNEVRAKIHDTLYPDSTKGEDE